MEVRTYTMSREEIEKLYGPVIPPKSKRIMKNPLAGQYRKVEFEELDISEVNNIDSTIDIFSEVDYIDPEWGP